MAWYDEQQLPPPGMAMGAQADPRAMPPLPELPPGPGPQGPSMGTPPPQPPGNWMMGTPPPPPPGPPPVPMYPPGERPQQQWLPPGIDPQSIVREGDRTMAQLQGAGIDPQSVVREGDRAYDRPARPELGAGAAPQQRQMTPEQQAAFQADLRAFEEIQRRSGGRRARGYR